MLKETFANRLQKALNMNNMTQAKLSEKTGLDKSLISNYLSGNYKARQDNLTILAETLNVSETWLMGYDVPINSKNEETTNELEQILFSKAKQLSDEEKKTIISVIEAIHKDVDKELDK